MNPFVTPDRCFIAKRPYDMRAGIQSLAMAVVADFGQDPTDGALYCFVSKDCKKMKMLRFDNNGWCLYYCRLDKGTFSRNRQLDSSTPALTFDRMKLHLLLDGLDPNTFKTSLPAAAHRIL